ncbi:MAG: hypothetical protein ACREL5_11125 [Gemmatimonadales bacterium]
MPGRVARLIFRGIGWIATPLVLLVTAAAGAAFGLVAAPLLPPYPALVVSAGFALLAALIGLVLWIRLLRRNPTLRHTLEMTVEGVPESPLVEHLIHPDGKESDAP